MDDQLNVLSPFLVKAEVLLVLVAVLIASVVWLFWEIFSFMVDREKEETNPNWWEALRNCPHRRLIIPPQCVEEVPELGTLSRLTTATTNAMKNMTGVIQRTSHLISGGSAKAAAAAKRRGGSRSDLAVLQNQLQQHSDGGNISRGNKVRRRGSKQHLAGTDPTGGNSLAPALGAGTGARITTPNSINSGNLGAFDGSGVRPKPLKLDLTGEDGGGGGGASTMAMAEMTRAVPGRRAASNSTSGLPSSCLSSTGAAAAVEGPLTGTPNRGRMRFLPQQQQQSKQLRQRQQQQQQLEQQQCQQMQQQQQQQEQQNLQPQKQEQQFQLSGELTLQQPPLQPSALAEAKDAIFKPSPLLSGGGADISSSSSSTTTTTTSSNFPPAHFIEGEAITTPAQPIRPTSCSTSSTSGGGGGGPAPGSSGGGTGGGGYIFAPLPDDCTPVLAFVNSRSGVSQGPYLIHQLRRLLNPVQVVDLANEDPTRALRQFLELPRLRVLVCGGDGTAKWIMNCLEDIGPECWPPIAILPLGTGNDLARVLGWGGGYNNESIVEFLAQVQRAHVVVVDRWELKLMPAGKAARTKMVTFNNYFGIGVDAQAALKFHHLREQKPQLFFSRLLNKLWYGMLGAQDLFRRTCVSLPERVKIVADGNELILPPHVQGVIFLNIESYGGGVKLWNVDGDDGQGGGGGISDGSSSSAPSSDDGGGSDDEGKRPRKWRRRREQQQQQQQQQQQHQQIAAFTASSMQDGLLEVVAVNGVVHLGQLQVGLSKAVKLCQCREAVITTTRDLPMQVDGEPWPQARSIIKIGRKKDPAYLLRRTMDSGGAVVGEVVELLESAVNDGVITLPQKKSLLAEFSRRVEMKRKVFEQELSQNEGVPSLTKGFDVSRLRLTPDSHTNDCSVM